MSGRQKAEGRKRKAEGRRQKAEGRRQKAESRRQKAESRKQKAEDRKQSFALLLSADCLLPCVLVGRAGIEPATHGLRVRCSTN